MPSPTIERGNRVKNAAVVNDRAPGVFRIPEYGEMSDLRGVVMMPAGYLFDQKDPECEAIAMAKISDRPSFERPGVLGNTPTDEGRFRELLTLARSLAHTTGQFLLTDRPLQLQTETKSTSTDVVTEMDRAAEDRIISGIQKVRPRDGYLGEEGGRQGGSSGVTWIIDPIDGTTNYLYGIPMWAVSIAVALDGDVVVGVVDAPALGVQYFSHRGGGSWLIRDAGDDPVPLACSTQASLSQSLLATGFGYETRQRESQARILTGVLPKVRDLRRAGAASLDLCWVAEGLVDGYYEFGLQPWDFAAGALIAQESGARVGDLHGGPPGAATTYAAAPGIADALRSLLIEYDADSC
jgi:myo-inositol-1(or 4)-monophosphatase